MLSRRDRRTLSERLTSSDHDYLTWAPLSGEPFLEEGLLCYFDGEAVEVVGVPVGPSLSPPELQERVQAVFARWAAEPGVVLIHYLGPQRPLAPPGSGWRLEYEERPRLWNRDVFVDLRQPVAARRKTRQDLRRAVRSGLRVRVRRRTALGHEHLSLLRALGRRAELDITDALFLANASTLLGHTVTRVFEARVRGRLVGFAIAHRHFATTPFMTVAAFDKTVRGASDLVYATVLEYYQQRGAREIGLGPATGRGLFRYKTKWGQVRLGPPLRQLVWERPPDCEGADHCIHWPWRLLARAQADVTAAGARSPVAPLRVLPIARTERAATATSR